MTIYTEVRLVCDACGEEETTDDVAADDSAEDILDREGWGRGGKHYELILCPDCLEKDD